MENQTAEITYEDFTKIDMRVGMITKSERVPKSEKLLNLQVYFGEEIGTRTILAGIGKDYSPENIVGLQVVAVVNLAPRKMMGFESHGMLLATVGSAGLLALAGCNGAAPGARLG